jgi:hypothetical protein
MTQQYLIGEFSVCLERLQAATVHGAAQEVARLRHQVEMGPPASLGAAALAWYHAAGDVIAATFGRKILPVWPLR